VQLIGSIGMFLLPAFLFAFLTHPSPAKYLGLRLPGKPVHWLLVVLIFLGAIPVMSWLQTMMGHINFSASVKGSQKINDDMFAAYLTMPTISDFIKIFFVFAILPAFGEELFFRGVIMRLAKKRSTTMLFPIVFTSLVFAISHTNIMGLPSIFLAGVLLSLIYYYTGSLWCSMLAHLLNNGFQIILIYLSHGNSAIKDIANGNSLPAYLPLAGAVILVTSFCLLYKTRTPLPHGWESDFTTQELLQKPE